MVLGTVHEPGKLSSYSIWRCDPESVREEPNGLHPTPTALHRGRLRENPIGKIAAAMRAWDTSQKSIKVLIEEAQLQGFNLADYDSVSGMSLIHFAARSGANAIGDDASAAAVVSQLLRSGVAVNLPCLWSRMTPLHYCAMYGSAKCIAALAERKGGDAGLDLDAKVPGIGGRPTAGVALHLAVIGGHVEAVRALLAAEADKSMANGFGQTPLMAAEDQLARGFGPEALCTEEEIVEIVELLKGANSLPRGEWVDYQGDFCAVGGYLKITREGRGYLRRRGQPETEMTVTATAEGTFAFALADGGEDDETEWKLYDGKLQGNLKSAGGAAHPKWWLHRQTEALKDLLRQEEREAAEAAERQRLADEDTARRIAEAEAHRMAEDEAARLASDEAARKLEEMAVADTARRAAEDEVARKLAEDEATRLAEEMADADAARRAAEDEAARLLAEAEVAQREADEAARLAALEAARLAEQEEARKRAEEAAQDTGLEPIYVGDRVLVNNRRVGIVKFKDYTKFKPGKILYGIALERPDGNHNGTVGLITYFRAKPKHGIFSPRSRLKLLRPEDIVPEEAQKVRRPMSRSPPKKAPVLHPFKSHTMSTTRTAEAQPLQYYEDAHRRAHRDTTRAGIKKKLKARAAHATQHGKDQQGAFSLESPGRPMSMAEKTEVAGGNAASLGMPLDAVGAARARRVGTQVGAGSFGLASKVLVRSSGVGMMAKVKYVGPSHAGDGTFIGVELISTRGLPDSVIPHSGTVDGMEYFTCKPDHGLLVAATDATFKGKPVAELV